MGNDGHLNPAPAAPASVSPAPPRKSFFSFCWERWNKIKPFWDLVVVFLTVIMLYLAFRQYRDSKSQLEQINLVSERISTKYLKDFPSTLGPIGQFISHTENHLDIMLDFLGYGDFSSPDDFENLYISELKKLCLTKKVRIIIYDNETAREALKRQFPNNENGDVFSKFKASRAFEGYFVGHHKTYLGNTSYSDFIKNLKYEQFLGLLLDDEDVHRKELENLKMVQIHRAHGPQFAVLLWIRDGRDAVFSFPFSDQELLQKLSANQLSAEMKRVSGNDLLEQLSKEVTFQSSDRDLINVFQELFEEEWRRSAK